MDSTEIDSPKTRTVVIHSQVWAGKAVRGPTWHVVEKECGAYTSSYEAWPKILATLIMLAGLFSMPWVAKVLAVSMNLHKLISLISTVCNCAVLYIVKLNKYCRIQTDHRNLKTRDCQRSKFRIKKITTFSGDDSYAGIKRPIRRARISKQMNEFLLDILIIKKIHKVKTKILQKDLQ